MKKTLVWCLCLTMMIDINVAHAANDIQLNLNKYTSLSLPIRGGETDDPNDPNSSKSGDNSSSENKNENPRSEARNGSDDVAEIILPDKGQRRGPAPIPGTGASTGDNNRIIRTPVAAQPRVSGVKDSLLPGLSCPLLENRPHLDVLAAIENLNNHVSTVSQCEGNVKLAEMTKLANTIKTSYGAMAAFMNNNGGTVDPSTAVDPATAMVNYQTAAEQMFNAIEGIGKQLESNELLNYKSDCGKALLTTGDIVLAVSDLVIAVTPFIFMGMIMNPAMLAGTLKFMLPISGVAAVSKVLSEMRRNEKLNMKNPVHQKALLQNLCEFWKISERVRYINLAQSGQIEELTKQLSFSSAQPLINLRNSSSARVLKIVETRDIVIATLQAFHRQNVEQRTEFAKILEGKKLDQDTEICAISRFLVKNVKSNQFPAQVIKNYHSIIERQQNSTLNQRYLISSEENTRAEILLNNEPKTDSDFMACSRTGKRYLGLIEQMLNDTDKTLVTHAKALRAVLVADVEYMSFEDQEAQIKEDQALVDKVTGILKALNQNNGALTRFDINNQTDALQRALLGKQGAWHLKWANGSSPVRELFKYMNDVFRNRLQTFSNQYDQFVDESFQATPTGPAGSALYISMAHEGKVVLTKEELQLLEQRQKDIATSRVLGNLTIKSSPVGSKIHEENCRRLTNSWINWIKAVDALETQEFYCKTIRNLVNDQAEEEISQHCYGTQDLFGRSTSSVLAKQRTRIRENGLKAKALIISGKLHELKCEAPNMAQTMR